MKNRPTTGSSRILDTTMSPLSTSVSEYLM